MPSQPEAQGDILKEFREGTFLSSLDTGGRIIDPTAKEGYCRSLGELTNEKKCFVSAYPR